MGASRVLIVTRHGGCCSRMSRDLVQVTNDGRGRDEVGRGDCFALLLSKLLLHCVASKRSSVVESNRVKRREPKKRLRGLSSRLASFHVASASRVLISADRRPCLHFWV